MGRQGAKTKREARVSASSKARKPAYLFVYGTLVRGEKLHEHLTRLPGTRYLGDGKIRAALYSLPGEDYPGAVLSNRKGQFVRGELYLMARPVLALRLLDELEGTDEGLFQRRIVDVLANGGKRRAWTYLYARPLQRAKLIPSGDFRRA